MITARHLAAAVLLGAATACSTSTTAPTATPLAPAAVSPVPRTAEEVVTDLTLKVGSARKTVVFTAETDPNKLLGRPNGYASKASFVDTRVKAGDARDSSEGAVDLGGSVEVYADEVGAAARKKFIGDAMKAAPILGSEYSYVSGPVLLRVSHQLTPTQAAEYEAALQS